MRLLFLSRWFPYPPSNGSKIRIYNLLRGLAGHHDVTLLSFVGGPGEAVDHSELTKLCREVKTVPLIPFNPTSRKARLGFLNSTPRWAVDTYSAEMEQCIHQTLAGERYDAVIASQVDMAVYASCLEGIPALFEEAEVGALYERYAHAASAWQRFRYGLTWTKHRRYLARLLSYFQACTVVSEREKELLTTAVPGFRNIHVLPNCVNLSDYSGVEAVKQTNRIIFTGSLSYGPNYDAMLWFLQEVYPLVEAEVEEVHLIITGDPAGRTLPPARNVELTGFVEDIHSLLAASTVSLAPIRSGGGTRLKILEAMALRTPVVSTPKGAEGLDVRQGENILLADTKDAFAEKVICLLKDQDRSRRIAENAYALVQSKYDWGKVLPGFIKLIEQL